MPRIALSARPSSSSDQAVVEVVTTGAAVLLGDGQPEKAQVTELADDADVHRFSAVPLGRVRHDLALDELARNRAEQLRCSGVSSNSTRLL